MPPLPGQPAASLCSAAARAAWLCPEDWGRFPGRPGGVKAGRPRDMVQGETAEQGGCGVNGERKRHQETLNNAWSAKGLVSRTV